MTTWAVALRYKTILGGGESVVRVEAENEGEAVQRALDTLRRNNAGAMNVQLLDARVDAAKGAPE